MLARESIEPLLQRLDSAIAVVKHCTPKFQRRVEKLLQRNLAVSHLVHADLRQVHASAALALRRCEDSGNPISRDERITHMMPFTFSSPALELTLFVVDGCMPLTIAHFNESQPLALDADCIIRVELPCACSNSPDDKARQGVWQWLHIHESSPIV